MSCIQISRELDKECGYTTVRSNISAMSRLAIQKENAFDLSHDWLATCVITLRFHFVKSTAPTVGASPVETGGDSPLSSKRANSQI